MEGDGTSNLLVNTTFTLTDSEPEENLNTGVPFSDGSIEHLSRKRSRKKSGHQVKKLKSEHVYECSVCLSKIREKRMGNPSGCKHNFCVLCIKKWAKNNCSCPLDRSPFDWINIIDKVSGSLVMKVDREGKKITGPCISICSVCSLSESPKLMISCDSCSEQTHIGCLADPDSVSISSWLCVLCKDRCPSELDADACKANSLVRCLVLQKYKIHLHAMSLKKNNSIINPRNVGLTNLASNTTKPPASRPPEPLPLPQPSETQDVLNDIMTSMERTFHDRNPRSSSRPDGIPPTTALPQTSSSTSRSPNVQKSRLLFVERIAKDILMPYYLNKTVTTEKAKQILKIVVPKVCKETSPSIDQELLKQIVQEKVLVWLDIL